MGVELDKSQEWRDVRGRLWWWSDRDGWVVDGKATWGGFWPAEEHWPFTLDCRHTSAVSEGSDPPIVTCTECGADLSPKLTQEREVTAMITLSVCAEHSPISYDEMADDGRMHMSATRLAELRRQSAAHMATCSRGPIVAFPVAISD